ncbi:hypothetical protein [Terriglobus tenax]|uniref:hypothetical protein n=1 Tax=Terriglobus tenax TaxID=1111115 RepID=UPI0021E01788|nr:hypothetical protein [Terriglobus tenax]
MQSSLKIRTITPITAASLIEPEDARITGQTRSLPRRLLALNMPTPQARKTAMPAPAAYNPQARIA